MRAKHPEMASDQVEMGLKWGGLAPESARIIEKRVLTSAAKLRPLGISAACYGLLPCVFKLLAAAALWRAMRRHPVLRGQA